MKMKSFLSGSIFFPEKPSEKELEFYKKFYTDTQMKENLFYQAVNNGHNKKELEETAYNFLFYLNLFNVNVPKNVRKKDFKDFKVTKDLAKVILNGYLSRNNIKVHSDAIYCWSRACSISAHH